MVPQPSTPRVVVIGAGVGGLAAAIRLAARGLAVTVLERAAAPGGKMRQVMVDGAPIDAGPTVFTMRWVFDELFDAAGTALDAHIALRPLSILARHRWDGDASGAVFDLHADAAASADAIGVLAGAAEAQRFRRFLADARAVYRALDEPFLRAAKPGTLQLVLRAGFAGSAALLRANPYASLWQALGRYFHDPRLRQLFGRYSTYCGASPFAAPATLMLVAHVEQDGVWQVDGGMHAFAQTLAALAAGRGATLEYGAHVQAIEARAGRVAAVTCADGRRFEADAVIVNADCAAVAAGCFGADAQRAVPAVPLPRSLSALTWQVHAPSTGFPLTRHNVFFSNDYRAEFDAIFGRGALPAAPTVYVCAQDRDDAAAPRARDRLLVLSNAPARGDDDAALRAAGVGAVGRAGGEGALSAAALAACEDATFALLARCGLQVERDAGAVGRTGPREFGALFPATGGALYGPATHGARATFLRHGARTRMAGLYLAGGSVHPGPGVPMAALSGRQAALAVQEDLA